MPKFRDYFRKMTEENQELFAEFAAIHARYAMDKADNQEKFNEVGEKVQEVVREWEGRLCGYSERGDKAVFSKNSAEKFQAEVKAFFPLIDFVGVEVVKKGSETNKANTMDETNKTSERAEVDPDVAEIDEMGLENVDDFVIKKLL